MTNNAITEQLEIAAPASAVWRVVSDVATLPDVLSGMTRVEIEGADATMRVGLAWTQTRVIAGRSGSERLEVTSLEPGSSYVTEGGGYGIQYLTTWAVEATGAHGCRLTCTFVGVPRTWVARALMKVFGGFGGDVSRRAMRTDLVDVANAAGAPER